MTSPTKMPCILMVDDDVGLLRLVEKALQREGFSFVGVSSGREGLKFVRESEPELLLLDLQLPDVSGPDLIRELLANKSGLRFMVITGRGDEHTAVRMMKMGAVDYLVKDSEFLDLLPTVVERALKQVRQERKLAAAESALEQEHALTSAILETTASLLLVLDREGRIVRFNAACEKLTGYSSAEVKGKLFWDYFVRSEEALGIQSIFAELARSNFPLEQESWWRTKSGRSRLIVWCVTALRGPSDQIAYFIASGIDITERKRAERRLGALYTVTRVLAESSLFHEAGPKLLQAICESLEWEIGEIWRVENERKTLGWHSGWHVPTIDPSDFIKGTREMTFSPGQGLPGRVWASGHPVWNTDLNDSDLFLRVALANKLGFRSAFGFPIVHGREVIGVMTFFSRSVREPDDYLLKMMSDIGSRIGQFIDRKRLEQEILKISEVEQRRIGQDLHDGLSQHLAGTELMSQVLESNLSKKNKAAAAQAGRIAEHVREAIAQTRLLARGLFPVELEAHGLMSALEELTVNVRKLFRVDCEFHCTQTVPVKNHATATHLYRIAQEATHNAIKHGRAGQIIVSLSQEGDRACLAIEDDGKGISGVSRPGNGMGLRIMKYRAGMIGATLNIRPAEARGTVVECFFKNSI